MMEQGSQGDPDVAVDVLLAGGTGGGGVMDTGTLDARSPAGGRRVVEGHAERVAGVELLDNRQRLGGQEVGVAARRVDAAIGLAEIVGDAGGPEPGGDGAAAAGEQDAEV